MKISVERNRNKMKRMNKQNGPWRALSSCLGHNLEGPVTPSANEKRKKKKNLWKQNTDKAICVTAAQASSVYLMSVAFSKTRKSCSAEKISSCSSSKKSNNTDYINSLVF